MSFSANKLGIFDLDGNVSEWCQDWFNSQQKQRVRRGSAWVTNASVEFKLSHRNYNTPGFRRFGTGFRCVIELTNQPPAAAEALVVPPTKPQTPPATQVPAKKAESATPTLPTGPTTWTDTKGRSITATFKALASGNVLLDIAGKVTPVPLNTLSAESQKLARDYHDQSNPATTNDPAQATKDKPFTNTLGMKFVPVQIASGPSGGQRVIFSIWETRAQDYEAFAEATQRSWPKPTFAQEATHPAVFISWADA
jgi:hypothetical protein